MKTLTETLLITLLLLAPDFLHAAGTLPPMLDDATYWRLITTFSEPGGTFRYQNLLSNESSYQMVLPQLERTARSAEGAYIGVGPEQNFTYIAALQPKIAFIVDIRRQNMLEHLMYKALFETSTDRAEFISQLFSRKRPVDLEVNATAQRLFAAYEAEACDLMLFGKTLSRIKDRLIVQHHFPIRVEDQQTIESILRAFCQGGPQIDYGFIGPPSSVRAPSYASLMTATDGRGENRSFLANETNFTIVRQMHSRNLIVPLTGDFAGPKTLRSIAAFLKFHHATMTTFYISNVEQYLDSDQHRKFRDNVSALPAAPISSVIRFIPPQSTVLELLRIFLSRRGSLFHLMN